MVFIKSSNKRKNVLASLIVAFLMAGGIMTDIAYGPSQLKQDGDLLFTTQINAGWFWGRDVNKDGDEVYRVFGIAVHKYDKCATYD